MPTNTAAIATTSLDYSKQVSDPNTDLTSFASNQHTYASFFCPTCNDTHHVPVYCGHRFCPVCSVRRRARVRARLEHIISQVKLTKKQRWKLLTLTLRSEKDLAPMVRKLIAGFRKLRQRSFWKRSCAGGAFVVEVTAHNGMWHAHIHAVLQSDYIPQQQISAAWLKLTGSMVVDIRAGASGGIVGYLVKYITKQSVNAELLPHVSEALKACRLMQPFGTWHGLAKTWVQPPSLCPGCKSECRNWIPIMLIFPGESFYRTGLPPPWAPDVAAGDEPSDNLGYVQETQ